MEKEREGERGREGDKFMWRRTTVGTKEGKEEEELMTIAQGRFN